MPFITPYTTAVTSFIRGVMAVLLLLLPLAGYPQETTKKVPMHEDYKKWHQLVPYALSPHGKWVAYGLHYESSEDTLFVGNGRSTAFSIPGGSHPFFVGESHLVCELKDNRVGIINLADGKSTYLDHAARPALVAGKLLAYTDAGKTGNALVVANLYGVALMQVNGTLSHAISPDSTRIAVSCKEEGRYVLKVLGLNPLQQLTFVRDSLEPYNVQWAKDGRALAFLKRDSSTAEQTDRGSVHLYDFTKHRLFSYRLSQDTQVTADRAVAQAYSIALSLSEDGKKVFFCLEPFPSPAIPDPEKAQVWNTADRNIYPAKAYTDNWTRRAMLAVWQPYLGTCRQIGTSLLPYAAPTVDSRYAITSNPLAYEPQYSYYGPRDYYLVDLGSGASKKILTAHSGNVGDMLLSPTGKYVLYFRDGHWWGYDIKQDSHKNLTEKMPLPDGMQLPQEETDGYEYQSAGCSLGDRDILVYDRYDIWRCPTDGGTPVRLTHGRESKTVFRILGESALRPSRYSYDGYSTALYDLSRPLFLKARNEERQESGFYLWSGKTGLRELVFTDRLTRNFMLSSDGKAFMYTEEDFDRPPGIIKGNIGNTEKETIANSNPQHANYIWGHSRLVTFTSGTKVLHGALFFPAGYDPGKTYPMIVHVYQQQARELHAYVNPSLQDHRGFNITNYISGGYFVFLPDIVYDIGSPGPSAASCVNAAVSYVKAHFNVDPGRIGLIGHSFGGFETNFIVTQPNPFRTAVSGAGYADLVADYFYIARDFMTPEYWRYEQGQMRIGTPFFEDPGLYRKNSPLLLAEGVSLPLLSWTGEKDFHVDATHSFKFHMALRRLKKESILLVYPQEQHVLMQPAHQQDLSLKIEQWFDYYLKDGPRQDWMLPDYMGQ